MGRSTAMRIVSVVLLVAPGLAAQTVADPPKPGQWYSIQNKHSRLFLDVTWGSRDVNAAVGQSDKSTFEGGAAQAWQLVPAEGGWYRLEVRHSMLYLDVTWGSADNNAPVGQAGESTFQDGAAQLWKLIPTGGGWYRLQVKHSGKFLDVTWGSTAQNAPVGQAGLSDFQNGAAQLWRFMPVTAAPVQPSPASSPLRISEVIVDSRSDPSKAVFRFNMTQAGVVQIMIKRKGWRDSGTTVTAQKIRDLSEGAVLYGTTFSGLPDGASYDYRVWSTDPRSRQIVERTGNFSTPTRIDCLHYSDPYRFPETGRSVVEYLCVDKTRFGPRSTLLAAN